MPKAVAAAASHDAVATLVQVLRARAKLREARRLSGGVGGSAAGQEAGCEVDALGGDMSPLESAGAERTFEGRVVNGWVI